MWISRSLKQVLDARDPGACRSPALEREADQQGFSDGENMGKHWIYTWFNEFSVYSNPQKDRTVMKSPSSQFYKVGFFYLFANRFSIP
jgi:hypothetical protein